MSIGVSPRSARDLHDAPPDSPRLDGTSGACRRRRVVDVDRVGEVAPGARGSPGQHARWGRPDVRWDRPPIEAGRRADQATVTVLVSGGVASSACLAYYLRRGHTVRALWIDCGQPAALPERLAAARLARHFHVPFDRVRLGGVPWRPWADPLDESAGLVTLASVGLSWHVGRGQVALGLHQDLWPTADAPGSAGRLAGLAALLADGCVGLDFPFATWSKGDVRAWALAAEVPLHLTFSCLVGPLAACGTCPKCLQRRDWPA